MHQSPMPFLMSSTLKISLTKFSTISMEMHSPMPFSMSPVHQSPMPFKVFTVHKSPMPSLESISHAMQSPIVKTFSIT
jgi:hypothetical protein